MYSELPIEREREREAGVFEVNFGVLTGALLYF
jgi:hypothetical protein